MLSALLALLFSNAFSAASIAVVIRYLNDSIHSLASSTPPGLYRPSSIVHRMVCFCCCFRPSAVPYALPYRIVLCFFVFVLPLDMNNRSKRGCNGGTPCEQCIRREQPCTYSQRRKSGPRGRPVRQQSATPPPPSCSMLGVRTSSRRTKGTSSFSARDRSPEPSTVSSPSSSPNRVASVSSSGSSSPSDYSASDDSFSDSETEAFTEAD
ncbi:unnamed protein product, partial [Laminaria digitata]